MNKCEDCAFAIKNDYDGEEDTMNVSSKTWNFTYKTHNTICGVAGVGVSGVEKCSAYKKEEEE